MRAGVRTSRNTWVTVGPVGCLAVIFAPLVALVAFASGHRAGSSSPGVAAVILPPLLALTLVSVAYLVLLGVTKYRKWRYRPSHK